MSRLSFICAAVALSFSLTGCLTYDEGAGRTVLGGQTSRPSPKQQEEFRREARIAELENTVRRLGSELDEMGSSINNVSSRADTYTRQVDARSSDAAVLRAEIAALHEELNAVKAKVDAIPATFSSLLEENRKAVMADVDRAIRASAASRPTSGGSSTGKRAGGSGKYYEHQVGDGQTLSEIAKVYEVSVSDIMSENNINDASLIRVGQKLLIPAK